MKIDFKSIFKSKEKRRDAAYAAATIAIIALTIGLFIWSVNVVLRAVDAAFVIGGEEDVSSAVLSFNLKGFTDVAPLLGIVFNPVETPVEAPLIIPPQVQQPVLEPETVTTSTATSTEAVTSTISTSTLNE